MSEDPNPFHQREILQLLLGELMDDTDDKMMKMIMKMKMKEEAESSHGHLKTAKRKGKAKTTKKYESKSNEIWNKYREMNEFFFVRSREWKKL